MNEDIKENFRARQAARLARARERERSRMEPTNAQKNLATDFWAAPIAYVNAELGLRSRAN